MGGDRAGHDPERLHNALSLVYLFVDHLNLVCARQVARDRMAPTSRVLLHRVWADLPKSVEEWAPRSEMYEVFQRCGALPSFDEAVIDQVMRVLVRPAVLKRGPADGDRLRSGWISGTPNLPALTRPEVLKQNVYVYEAGNAYSFSSSSHLDTTERPRDFLFREWHVGALLSEEFFDPMAVIRKYLAIVCQVKEGWVGHYIQQWIRDRFQIEPGRDFRYALARVCDRFNQIFYGATNPGRPAVRGRRAATVGTALLLHEFALILADPLGETELPRTYEGALPRAVGVYLFMRLRRLLRHRFVALDALTLAPDEDADPAVDDAPLPEGELTSAVRKYWLKLATHQRQSVDVLRPLEYSFIQTAIFGIQTGIEGLNFVFRGGLLPRVDAGRAIGVNGQAGSGKTVFALHLLADIAAKGGFCVYFSFEEDYDSILDRLVTFNLASDFEIRTWGDDIAADGGDGESHADAAAGGGDGGEGENESVQDLLERLPPTEGLLLLYQLPRDRSFSLPEVIRQFGEIPTGRQRVLAVDSINALQFHAREEEPGGHRQAILEVVEAINDCDFLGVILNESDDEANTVLPYLVDTMVELLHGKEDGGRRLQITKCRSQNCQHGRHPYRLSERKGFVIHPALTAIRSTLRGRIPATLSEQRGILLAQRPGPPGEREAVKVREKSSVLITGGHGTGKSLLALQLLTEPSRLLSDEAARKGGTRVSTIPKNVMVITFKTSEVKFRQILRRNATLDKRWRRIPVHRLRWYSPGSGLTADQIVSEIRKYILQSRREGVPVERILFDETDLAEHLLPALKRESLFWSTVLDLVATEAITSIFVAGNDHATPSPAAFLQSEVDYAFHLTAGRAGAGPADEPRPVPLDPTLAAGHRFYLEVRNAPPMSLDMRSAMELVIDRTTGLLTMIDSA